MNIKNLKKHHFEQFALILVLFFFQFNAFSQIDDDYFSTTNNTATVSGHAMLAIPVFNFGSTELKRESSYASTGFGAGVNIGYQTSFIEWLIQVNYFNNPIRTKNMAEDLSARDTVRYFVNAKNYQSRNLLVGTGFPIIQKEKFHLQLAGLIGMTYITRPQMDYSMITNNGTERYSESEANDIEFSYSFQMRSQYQLQSGLYVSSHILYLASRTGYQYRSSRGGKISKENSHQPLTLFSLGLGVGFSF